MIITALVLPATDEAYQGYTLQINLIKYATPTLLEVNVLTAVVLKAQKRKIGLSILVRLIVALLCGFLP